MQVVRLKTLLPVVFLGAATFVSLDAEGRYGRWFLLANNNKEQESGPHLSKIPYTSSSTPTLEALRLIAESAQLEEQEAAPLHECFGRKHVINNETTVASLCSHCLPQWTWSQHHHHHDHDSSNSHGLRRRLSAHSVAPVTSLWNRFKKQIRQAAFDSLHDCYGWPGGEFVRGNYSQEGFHQLTERLFSALTSYRLKKSIKVPPNPLIMEKVAQVILRRMEDPEHNPPLMIAVFGGSVTEGCWSARNTGAVGLPNVTKCVRSCTWTVKLERLLNKVLGNNTVVVKNYGVAGTDSSVGSILFKYDLWRDINDELKGEDFDIFIFAYGPNDGQGTPERKEFLYESMQTLMRLAAEQRPCSDLPLVMQLEDVMMDAFNPKLKDSLWYMRHMKETAAWGSYMAVSYADAIRDYIYANPSDWTLAEYGQLHPGLGFHTGVSWVVAYNLLSGFVDSCDASSMAEYNNPEPRAGFALPVITDETKSTDVPRLWNESSVEKSQMCAARGAIKTTCVYKWIAAKQGANTKQLVHEAVSSVATNIDGWEAIGFPVRQPKRTWQATKSNATFTIQLSEIESAVNKMLVLYLRSYGRKWADARLQVLVEGRSQGSKAWTELHQALLEGTHDSQTSINYSHEAILASTMEAGGSLRATFTLVGGSVFQVNGIAACHDAITEKRKQSEMPEK